MRNSIDVNEYDMIDIVAYLVSSFTSEENA